MSKSLVVLSGVFVAVSACGSGGDAPQPAARAAAADTGARQPTAQAAPATQQAPASTTPAGPRVGVARTGQLGAYLTDGNGRALYLLEEDRGGASTCYDMCAVIWPPFLAGPAAPAVADSAVNGAVLGSIPRRGGGAQATYAGHPLYYYLGDSGPGQTRGHHVEDSWGEWRLVSPTGRQVEGGERPSGRRGRGGRRGGEDDR